MSRNLLLIIAIGVLLCMCLNKKKEKFEGKVVLKNYYAPWCGHSKRLMPVWDRLADMHENNPSVDIKKIDCQLNPEIAKENDIKGFPTIVKYTENGKTVYRGDRSLDSLNKFIQES